MKKLLPLIICVSIFLSSACEDKEKKEDLEFILNTNVPDGYLTNGFSFKNMNIIAFPNSDNNVPDFIAACLMNDFGDITGTFLYHQNLEKRFVLLNNYEDKISAQNHFDTLSTTSNSPYQTFAYVKPYELWQIKTSTDWIGIILVLEARAEKIGSSAFAEIKFKAKKILPDRH